MKLPYKGGGVALFYKDKHTGEYSILLGKRTIEPGKGKWSIPGGGYEPQDASICATAQREFWKETGISLKTVCPASEPDMYRFRLPFFTWVTFLQEVQSTDFLADATIREFSELRFIPFSKLHTYKLAFGVKAEIRAFKRRHTMEV